MSRVTFNNLRAPFFATLNARVERYFEENRLRKTGNRALYVKSAVLIAAAVGTYAALIAVPMHPLLSAALWCVFGFAQAAIGFNVMHDANHGSFSTRKWLNHVMGLTANAMGANAWFWKQKHNIIHHTYTNVDGVDDDIIKSPLLRMCHTQKRFFMHRFQYIYCVFLYGLTSIVWIFLSDFAKYFQKRIQTTRLRKMANADHAMFWGTKILYCVLFIALPLYAVGLVPWLVGFSLMHFTFGFTLTIVFQLAHVVESTHFENTNGAALKIENEWAVHQVRSTANFATGNRFISWFTGGLNFQVEHHLYPKISHVHYPAIRVFVKETCAAYAVDYNEYPSMLSAMRSHFRFMKHLGTAA
ncbi:MAG TPA: acyl-CoA desaturase [Chitinophagales bacterium]|nr:acyl-CoA desaturase [Chitinophagales bacterium]